MRNNSRGEERGYKSNLYRAGNNTISDLKDLENQKSVKESREIHSMRSVRPDKQGPDE